MMQKFREHLYDILDSIWEKARLKLEADDSISGCVHLLIVSFFVFKSYWPPVWSIFKLTGCWVQMVFKQVLARAKEFGRATKLPWLSDSLSTAKQLVL